MNEQLEIEILKRQVLAVSREKTENAVAKCVSAVSRELAVMAVTPTDVGLSLENVPVLSLRDGTQLGGCAAPHPDAAVHLAVYKAFPAILSLISFSAPETTASTGPPFQMENQT